jgi:hypothetical protein
VAEVFARGSRPSRTTPRGLGFRRRRHLLQGFDQEIAEAIVSELTHFACHGHPSTGSGHRFEAQPGQGDARVCGKPTAQRLRTPVCNSIRSTNTSLPLSGSSRIRRRGRATTSATMMPRHVTSNVDFPLARVVKQAAPRGQLNPRGSTRGKAGRSPFLGGQARFAPAANSSLAFLTALEASSA